MHVITRVTGHPCVPSMIMGADRSSDPTSSHPPRCYSDTSKPSKEPTSPGNPPLLSAISRIRPQLVASSRRFSSRRIMAAPSTPAEQTARRQIKYATFESIIELPFYHSLAGHKINHDKLSEAPRRVLGQYIPGDEQRLQVQGDALSADEYASPKLRTNFTTRDRG